MRVLSVHQPWATLLALGFKRCETRTWQTHHRGPLAIHAARRRGKPVEIPTSWRPSLLTAQHRHGLDGWPELFPRGALLGVVEVLDCVKVEDLAADAVTRCERMLGDFSPNRWVWRLGSPRPLQLPLLLRGQQGVFEVPLPTFLPGLLPPLEECHVELA